MNEIKRLQKLAGINEIKVNNPLGDINLEFSVYYDDEDDNEGENVTFNIIKNIIPSSEIEVGSDYLTLIVSKKEILSNLNKIKNKGIKVEIAEDGIGLEYDGNGYFSYYEDNLDEIKVNKPGITEDEMNLIYVNLQGTRKPYDIDECEKFNINDLSKQYLEDKGFDEDWIEEQGDDNPLLNKNKIIRALKDKSIPIQNVSKKQAYDLGDVYINRSFPYSLLKYGNRYFFVDNQGYSYPRYVMEIIGL